jgi:hypothetical protein
MLYHILNYKSLFETINFFRFLGFHNNSFIIGVLERPDYLNIRHLPDNVLQLVKDNIKEWLDEKPGYLLEDGLQNVLQYVNEPIEKNLDNTLKRIKEMDTRRNIDSTQVFTEFYKDIN